MTPICEPAFKRKSRLNLYFWIVQGLEIIVVFSSIQGFQGDNFTLTIIIALFNIKPTYQIGLNIGTNTFLENYINLQRQL